MDKLKQWVVLTVLACLVIAAGGWFLVISPKRSEAADLRAQAEQQQSANATLETQLQVLKAQAKDLPKEQAKLAAVSAKIPADPALPNLIRALLSAASDSGVELVSLSPGEPVVAAAAAPVAAAPAPAQGQAAPPAGQLAEIPLSINVVGDYFEVQRFMAELEDLPRAVLVSTLDLAPGTSPTAGEGGPSAADGSSLTTTIEGKVFMAANRPAPATASVPGEAASTTAATTPAEEQPS